MTRIVFLNWRDVRSPKAGGAELLTHEVARRLVERGAQVTLFTSRPTGLPAIETIDGVTVVRAGSELTTRWFARRHVARQGYDIVIEEINTLPYFAHAWSGLPTLLFIPQLAREVWWYEARLPLSVVGYLTEPLYLSAYRHVESITISRSTADDLRSLGFYAPIHTIPMATSRAEPVDREGPTSGAGSELVIVGRLVPSKRVDHAIRALALVRRTVPDAVLSVIGDGPERPRLEQHARELGVDDAVRFLGRLTDAEKGSVLARASVLVACAVREGWGLTVTEAAQAGTPAVAYDIPGLRDSIVPGRTGLLSDQDPAALAVELERVLTDEPLRQRLRNSALAHTAALSWRQTGDAFAEIVEGVAR